MTAGIGLTCPGCGFIFLEMGSGKMRRNFWFFVYYALARHLPCSYARWGGPLFKSFRAFLGRRLLAECGENVNIESGARFGRGTNIWLGHESDLGVDCALHGEVHIGNNSFMGPEVVIWTQNHGFARADIPMMHQEMQPEFPVWIGDDVWIGTRAILLPGVHIGNHAIVGAGAVVTSDVPDWAIAVGNPARVIRYRKPQESAPPKP